MPTYEPPRGPLPEGIETGEVYGQVLVAVDDGEDVGIDTDSIPGQGFIRFIPLAPFVDYGDNIVLLDIRTAYLDTTGDFRIDLVATDNTAPLTDWTYLVQFFIPGLAIESFEIDVPAHSNRAITNIIPRTSSGTHVVVKGDKGDKGDMSIIGLSTFASGADLVIDDSQALYWGTGSPNGVLTKGKGNLYVGSNATSSNRLYFKTTATGNTGWVVLA